MSSPSALLCWTRLPAAGREMSPAPSAEKNKEDGGTRSDLIERRKSNPLSARCNFLLYSTIHSLMSCGQACYTVKKG